MPPTHGGTLPTPSTHMQSGKESILEMVGDSMTHWPDLVLDGMLILTVTVVIVSGVTVVWFLVWQVMKGIDKSEGGD